ncbi:MAG: S26 family signal peptidase, partial [Planctomycetota bacterium]|nr:S26 family signal peptidase [Planctomycetota bacterium]
MTPASDSADNLRALPVLNAISTASICIALTCLGCSQPPADQDHSSLKTKPSSPLPPITVAATVDGSSMATTLKGQHFAASCPTCKFNFTYDAITAARKKLICCPLCGQIFRRNPEAKIMPADKVKITRLDESTRIFRWDIIAYSKDGQNSVKRVLGLPLEQVSFRQGDLYINGWIVAKNARVQLETRIPIFDSDHAISRQLEIEATQSDSFPISLDSEDIKVNYIHRANYESLLKNGTVEDVKDFYGYNQATSRTLNRCDDLGCELNFDDIDSSDQAFESRVHFQTLKYGKVEFSLIIQKAHSVWTIHHNGRQLYTGERKYEAPVKTLTVYASLIDGRARLILQSES